MIIVHLFPQTILTASASLKSPHSQATRLGNLTANHGHRPRVLCRAAMHHAGGLVDCTPRSIIQARASLASRHMGRAGNASDLVTRCFRPVSVGRTTGLEAVDVGDFCPYTAGGAVASGLAIVSLGTAAMTDGSGRGVRPLTVWITDGGVYG